ncbi:MAG: inorganic phosphate transporter [bacterium]|nr:inorganic phosphate transporter [bacterium]
MIGNESQLFLYSAVIIAVVMLIWDTIEVGRNDAANIVNAVFGARVLKRRQAVYLAGFAVIVGAWASSPVMETARKEIFLPETLELHDALAIYLGVYITDTVLLYSFSAFGMPISTTAGLVFSLLGGGLALGGVDSVSWEKSGQVLLAIVCSILISGAMGFLVQRAFRGAIGKDCDDPRQVRLHGPWIAGALLTGLIYFMLIKGMKNVAFVKSFNAMTLDRLSDSWVIVVLIALWAIMSILAWGSLKLGGERLERKLFPGLAVVGMLAIAVAFGQNDLANCTSPGLASIMILRHGELAPQVDVPSWLLLICGLLLFVGMSTRNAQRVTRAQVNTGSQSDVVRLYAPRWCLWLASWITPKQHIDESGEVEEEVLAPEAQDPESKKLQHYDALRAAVITSVSASVIAFASGLGLPVSTTYVSFAAVVSTGWADRVFLRGDALIKLGRTIWVITCWFLSAFIAAIATGLSATLISVWGTLGIAIALAVNLIIRSIAKNRAEAQEERLRKEAAERKKIMFGDRHESMRLAADDDHHEM